MNGRRVFGENTGFQPNQQMQVNQSFRGGSNSPAKSEWKPSEDQVERDGRSVCVRNLDKRIDEQMLSMLFRPVGGVRTITLSRDKQGNSKGYAYVELASVDARTKAINVLNGQDILKNGRNIIVEAKRVNEAGKTRRKQNNPNAIILKALTQAVKMVQRGGRGRGRGRGMRGGMHQNQMQQDTPMQGQQGGFGSM